MLVISLILKCLERFYTPKIFSRRLIKWMMKVKFLAVFINKIYLKLSFEEKGSCHPIFAKLYRDNLAQISISKWIISFRNNRVYMPLRASNLWLDWDSALSIIGHDQDVKSAYLSILNSKIKINCFFDVGANYCTHSLLFLSQGIKTISFEPNIHCKDYFDKSLEINNLNGRFVNVGVGDTISKSVLVFPERDTWLGTIKPQKDAFVNQFENLQEKEVEIITLDSFVNKENIIPDLIKIDTEGFETKVLHGARKLLQSYKPIIIFEANNSNERKEIFNEITHNNYYICRLRPLQSRVYNKLSLELFINLKENNFIALHNDFNFNF